MPGVPAGGLYVASAPTGAQAESAIRIALPAGAETVRLTLHVAALNRINAPVVVGYPATGDWPTGGPQPWTARPAYRSNAAPAVGIFAPGNKTMTITFPASEATAGIVLVPGSSQMLAPTFTVSFAPPTSADVAVRGATRPGSPRPTTAPQTHRPTTSPAANNRPSHSPSPSRSSSARPARTSRPRPRPTASTTSPQRASTSPSSPARPAPSRPPTAVAADHTGSSHDGRDVAIAVSVAVVVAAAAMSLLLRRRHPRG
ncbi:MAG TPA: hypothetical protein VG899_05435 [Mycobacteriales bacterium]|nr:hypothetical protein [Mycobacteriales bacterium]